MNYHELRRAFGPIEPTAPVVLHCAVCHMHTPHSSGTCGLCGTVALTNIHKQHPDAVIYTHSVDAALESPLLAFLAAAMNLLDTATRAERAQAWRVLVDGLTEGQRRELLNVLGRKDF